MTRIELLVVLAITALLAALPFAGLAGAQERGRPTACRNNERQLMIALRVYGGDHRDQLPRAERLAPNPPSVLEVYLPLIAATTQQARLRYVVNSNVLDCPGLHQALVAPRPPLPTWRWPFNNQHQQVGYLYLAGRPDTPWPATEAPCATGGHLPCG